MLFRAKKQQDILKSRFEVKTILTFEIILNSFLIIPKQTAMFPVFHAANWKCSCRNALKCWIHILKAFRNWFLYKVLQIKMHIEYQTNFKRFFLLLLATFNSRISNFTRPYHRYTFHQSMFSFTLSVFAQPYFKRISGTWSEIFKI